MLCYFRRDFRTVVFDLDPYFFHIIAISPKLDSTIRLAADCLDGILQKLITTWAMRFSSAYRIKSAGEISVWKQIVSHGF